MARKEVAGHRCNLSLEDWEQANPEVFVYRTSGGTCRVYGAVTQLTPEQAWDLFHLTDYVVTSATGSSYTLLPV